MKKTQIASTLILTILILSILTPTIASAKTEEKTPVIVGFKDSTEKSTIRDNGWEIKHEYKIVPAVACKLTDQEIQKLLKNPKVDYIEEDTIVTLADPDPEGDNIASWSVTKIGADIVQDSGNRGTGIKVAVIDTGINYLHEDLQLNYESGYDFVNHDDDPFDDNGHGSHCAGIIAAQDNAINVVGVAPEAKLFALKVLNAQGNGYTSDIIAAIQWSIDNDMDIVSMSFGSSTPSTPLQQVCSTAFASGIVLVAAAGNNGAAWSGTNILYPARYAEVIAVGATNENNVRASFSNTGPELDIMAPGVNIYSTYIDVTNDGKNQDSWLMSGTSMAAPHIAGTAALILNSGTTTELAWKNYGYTDGNGVWSNQEVTNVLINTADDLGTIGKDNYYGYGIVDADQAAMTPPAPPLPPQTRNYKPNAVTTIIGSTSGSPLSLESNDETDLTIKSAKVSSDQRIDWYSTTTITEAKTQVTALAITYDGSYSRTVTQKIYLYNFASSTWYQINSQSVGTSDKTVTWSTNNPANYISDTGEIRLRNYATQRTTNTYNCLADYTAYKITYTPTA